MQVCQCYDANVMFEATTALEAVNYPLSVVKPRSQLYKIFILYNLQ